MFNFLFRIAVFAALFLALPVFHTKGLTDDQPIPGPRQDAEASLRWLNIKLYPPAMLLKLGALDVDIGITQSMTLGLSSYKFSYRDPVQDVLLTVPAVGIRLNYYFSGKRLTDGFFIAPSLYSVTAKLSKTMIYQNQSVDLSGDLTGGMFGLIAGYQWVWASGFNLDVGAGFYSYKNDPKASLSGTIPGTGTTLIQEVDVPVMKFVVPWIEFGVGWAF